MCQIMSSKFTTTIRSSLSKMPNQSNTLTTKGNKTELGEGKVSSLMAKGTLT